MTLLLLLLHLITKKTSVVGVDIGKLFDDALASLSSVKIKTLIKDTIQ